MPLWTLPPFLNLYRRAVMITVVFNAGEHGTNQLSIGKMFAFKRFTSLAGSYDFFHRGAPHKHAFAQITIRERLWSIKSTKA